MILSLYLVLITRDYTIFGFDYDLIKTSSCHQICKKCNIPFFLVRKSSGVEYF